MHVKHLASTVTVKAVRMASSFSWVGTMSGSCSRSRSAGGMAVQMIPVVCSTMKAIACCVTCTALRMSSAALSPEKLVGAG